MTILLGLDPGVHTGIATFQNGELVSLQTVHPIMIYEVLISSGASRVVFEDSRLTSPVWGRGTNAAAARKIARNVGQVDAFCSLIVEACERIGITAHGISPKGKGAKLNAEAFERVTSWNKSSNEHTRDAAMVAWPYRRGA
jgi:hypothetical protein